MLTIDSEKHRFHLRGKNMSYIMQVEEDMQVHHLYWGDSVSELPDSWFDRAPYRRASLVEHKDADSPMCIREFAHYECPTYGLSDFRMPALQAEGEESGNMLCDLRYVSFRTEKGRSPMAGLPCAHGSEEEAESLILLLRDPVTRLEVELYYCLFADRDIVTRHMRISNKGKESCRLNQVMSFSVDVEDGSFDLLTFDGTTHREFTPSIHPLQPGRMEVGSTRGYSSHQHNPNAVLLRPGARQNSGQAYGLSLVYSGNFTLRCEMDQYQSLRVQGGIHPQNFAWHLAPGESFETPEAVLSYSAHGLNGLSSVLHPFVCRNLIPSAWQGKARPVLLNTWEACYFNISQERLSEIASLSSGMGIELLVVDDGWFGHRDRADSSLGDWYPHRVKFPGGLKALEKMPMKLGLWMEPQMVSEDRDLYRSHPEWCLHARDRVRTLWRNQLVLDMSRSDVQDYLIECIDRILDTGIFSFIKWDCNRRMTQVQSGGLPASQQGEVFHRCMLGTYRLFEHIRTRYPQILLENCASGGGRYDYGMLCYCHQGWVSDNTDPQDRLVIQNSASVFFPPVVLTSHLTASPNHQTNRTPPFAFRRDVCALFNAGFELNLMNLGEEELQEVREACALFRQTQAMLPGARFTRLNDELIPHDWFGWMLESGKTVIIEYFRPAAAEEPAYWTIPVHGLKKDAAYRDMRDGTILRGSDIEALGLRPDWRPGDCFSELIVLEEVRQS